MLEDAVAHPCNSTKRIDQKDNPKMNVCWEIVKNLSDDEDEGYKGIVCNLLAAYTLFLN